MPSSGGHSCPQKDGFLQYMPRSWRLLLLDRRVHACDECLVAGLPRLRIHDGPQEQSKASQAFVGKQVDRKSTRLNSSHLVISYAVFCLKKNICGRTKIA